MRKTSANAPRGNRGEGNFRKDGGQSRKGPGSFDKGGDRQKFDRPGRKKDREEDVSPQKPGGANRSFGKREERTNDDRPFKNRDERDNGRRPTFKASGRSTESFRGKPGAGKPTFRKREDDRKIDHKFRGGGDEAKSIGAGPERSDRPFKRDKEGGEYRPARREGTFKPKDDKDRSSRKFGDGNRNDRPSADSRPFRSRPKPVDGKKSFGKPNDASLNPAKEAKSKDPKFEDVVKQAFNGGGKDKAKKMEHAEREQFEDKVYGELQDITSSVKKPYELKRRKDEGVKAKPAPAKSSRRKKYHDEEEEEEVTGKAEMPLNKFIAHSGECSRRDAAELVKQGKVKVNGELVMDPGYRVQPGDSVTMSGKKLTPQKKLVYLLLNKPKGYITTNEDPQGRKTVMDLVANSGEDRLFPVGRLDRDTTGLLLITNDGELTQKLSHPSHNVKKVYHVTLDKPLTKADFEKIMQGVELEDGKAIVDEMAYLETKSELGLEIHSGKNRIVRRIFESQGYVVDKLDRMMYAGLTKKNLPRGKWRRLTDHEVVLLKHFKS
jgi:23S rRNA pseudouridine2605 synthase